MKIDYHLHPNIINCPNQADEFIMAAIAQGFEEICFTDHMPFSITYNEFDRIPEGMVGRYCEEVKKKAEQYKDKISIKTGIEIDYYPNYHKEIESVISQGRFDYILGSSHLNIKGYNIPFAEITCAEYAKMVLNNYLSAIKSGYFNGISHLDIYRLAFASPNEFQFEAYEYDYINVNEILLLIFEELEKTKVRLEINAAPLYKKFDDKGAYPERGIIQISQDYAIDCIFGSDAHDARYVGYGYNNIIKDEVYKHMFKINK